jgi:hypothetical protein
MIMSYNGWKNWETWNVALWCDNEEGIYRNRMRAKPRTADECESFVREYFPTGTPDMADHDPYESRDAVDWEEIAEHWADDYVDDEEAA